MKILLFLACFAFSTVSSGQGYSHIKGTIPAWEGKKVFLQKNVDGDVVNIVDSAIVRGGQFELQKSFEEPEALFVKPAGRIMAIPLFISSIGTIELTQTADKIDVNNATGAANQQLFESLNSSLDSITRLRFALYDKYAELNRLDDQQGLAELRKSFDANGALQIEVLKKFLSKNNSSSVAIFALTKLSSEPAEVLNEYLNHIPVAWSGYPSIKKLRYQISNEARTAVGKVAPNFTQQDIHGRSVSLSDFKGKFVLLDFWASWCGPCRKENRNLVAAFHELKNKHFTILSISLDKSTDRQRWVNAIAKDGMSEWQHISDLRYFQNEVALLYGVTAIPRNFLIDPSGKIIAKDLRGDQLINTLKAILR